MHVHRHAREHWRLPAQSVRKPAARGPGVSPAPPAAPLEQVADGDELAFAELAGQRRGRVPAR
ncbi:hypothetical protein [Brachybacterium squillarum]|uniref:hypothetical protein n=1 Tax=Brachybacterium squillarum TaxID=661979 RepID=UPI001FDFDE89|nr:hypothetical protein [Brachybacterium squillarum]